MVFFFSKFAKALESKSKLAGKRLDTSKPLRRCLQFI